MQTSSLINLAKKQFPDWSREMLLGLLNELQLIIFTQKPTNQMRVVSNVGKDPTLTTVSGTYSYDIPDVWRISNVYLDSGEKIEVTMYDAINGQPARIVFNEDPGSQTYFMRQYRFPNELVTENIQLEIPESYHFSHVYEGLCGMVEKFRSGRSERYELFIQKLSSEVIKAMSDNHTRDASTKNTRGY